MKEDFKTRAAYVAAFLAGSFAGAAFGVFFALWLGQSGLVPGRPAPAAPPAAARTEDRVVAAVKSVSPSVVSVEVIKDVSKLYQQNAQMFPFQDFFGFPFPEQAPAPSQPQAPQMQQVGGGSGFVISADGMILTNRHVVLDTDAQYKVKMQDGKTYDAKVLARDPVLDLAVLKIDAKDLPVLALGDSDRIDLGQAVVAVGNALAEYQNTVTEGVISGINRSVTAGDGFGSSEVIEEAIQTDAAINPGNSGGPLVDLDGKAIGINTAVNQAGQSIGFAIPINAAKSVIDSVRANGRIIRPWLGVRYTIITKDLADAQKLGSDHGALVAKGPQSGDAAVIKGSPADKAGIQEGDIILKVGGDDIDEDHSLALAVAKRKPGDTIPVVLMRNGKQMTVLVTLGELPSEVK